MRFLRPSLTWLMPLDENIWFHRQIASSLLFWTIVHTTAHCESIHSPLDRGLTRLFRRQYDPRRADAGQEGDGCWDHVHSTWGVHGTRHAPDHVLDVSTKPSRRFGDGIDGRLGCRYTTAHQKIRTQCFEAFWYTHHLVRLPSLPRQGLDLIRVRNLGILLPPRTVHSCQCVHLAHSIARVY